MMPRSPGTLIVRADAGKQIGVGHVMRCLALGQAWQDRGGDVLFASHELPAHLNERLLQEDFRIANLSAASGSLADADELMQLANAFDHVRMVVDGYQFSPEYRQRLRDENWRVIAIDDYGDMRNADVVINQNAWAAPEDYSTSNAKVLAGSQFAMLRREFREERSAANARGAIPEKILVSCGGSDPRNLTTRILKLLAEVTTPTEVVVVAGGSCDRIRELSELCHQLPFSARLEHDVRDMSALMQASDLAIVAAGSTCWELASLGVPMITVVTADNQVRVAESVKEFGIGWSAGQADELSAGKLRQIFAQLRSDPALLSAAGRAGQELIDGLGACRVAEVLAEPVVTLRAATPADSRQLWLWRNNEAVRSVSFSTEPVPWEDHCRWFESRLERSSCLIQIAENEQRQPVGQVRFDIEGNRATISISLAADFRGCGYGTALIKAATCGVLDECGVAFVDAYIREDNTASQAAFRKAGYLRQPKTSPSNGDGLHFVAVGSKVERRAA